MRKKTKREIKRLIEHMSLNSQQAKRLIHEETPNLKLHLYHVPPYYNPSYKIEIQELMQMLLNYFNLELKVTEQKKELIKIRKRKSN